MQNFYITPTVESLEIKVERGFASSFGGMSFQSDHYTDEEEWS